jgi:hypothetical protein
MRRAVVIAILVAGCTQPRSQRCKSVCAREAECADSVKTAVSFDEKECIAACAALENDANDNAAKVVKHVDCVNRQQSCAAVLECQ